MAAYLDCFGCACLVRASEPSCPFCGVSLRIVPAASSRLSLGLVLGLGLATFGCGDKDGDTASETIADSNDDSDAVTYGGPDTFTSTVGTETITDDSQEADAVTYGGPDETTSIGDITTTTSDSSTGSSSGSSSDTLTDSDSPEADAVTYGGPDESTSTTGG